MAERKSDEKEEMDITYGVLFYFRLIYPFRPSFSLVSYISFFLCLIYFAPLSVWRTSFCPTFLFNPLGSYAPLVLHTASFSVHSHQLYLLLLFPTIKYSSKEVLDCIKTEDPIEGNMSERKNIRGWKRGKYIERGKKAK